MARIRWTHEAATWLEEIHIAYLLSGDDVVEVLGIFHGALDIDRYL